MLGRWRKLKPIVFCGGYHQIGMQGEHGKKVHYLVHRVVLTAFTGPCPEGMECCHNDGNPSNNHVSNLRWDTHAANSQDAIRHGNHFAGVRNNQAKLTKHQVVEIRARLAAGETQRSLAREYGVSQMTVSKIARRKRYLDCL
jgi:hypothetical protein